VVFQPHRYTRTERLLEDFGRALGAADVVVLTDIYAAGEDPIPGITIGAVADAVRRNSRAEVVVVPALGDVPRAVARLSRPGDLIVTLGAGSIGTAARRILEEIRRVDGRSGTGD
jgi:UDP-N-acetylmuramate--alanine ligase